jgi:transcriptional regulator with XRE-family HTH domain
MGTPGTPNYHGRQLLRELKRLRELAGMTQDDAGNELHLTLQKLSRIENGQLPGYHEMRAMLKVYGLPRHGWEPYLALWERARQRGWWRKFTLVDPTYVSMEQEAAQMTEFQVCRIPELLQTERYARAVYEHAMPRYNAKAIANNVAVRIRRQDRLYDDSPLVLHTLLHEPVLRQGVDRAQLVQLMERAEMPNVTLQLVPQSLGLHSGLDGSAILLAFDDPNEPQIVFTHSVLGLSQSQDGERASAVRTMLDHLAKQAMSPADSLIALKRLIS